MSVISLIVFSAAVFGEKSLADWLVTNTQQMTNGMASTADATHTALSEDDRAQSFVIHMFLSGKEYTFNTFSKFDHSIQTLPQRGGKIASAKYSGMPQFSLESLPSKDKKIFYQHVSEFINAGGTQSLVDVDVDVLAGDGSVIEKWSYKKCEVIGYWTYTDDNKGHYRFSHKLGIEIRDFTQFQCQSYSLKIS